MAGETNITIIGNVVADPRTNTTQNGNDVASIRVAVTPRTWDNQQNTYVNGQAEFYDVSVWRNEARNVAQSIHKGDRVIVNGNLTTRQYQTQNGENRTSLVIDRAEVAVSLRFATANIQRQQASNQQQQGGFGNQQQQGGFSNQQPQNNFGNQQQSGFNNHDEPPF